MEKKRPEWTGAIEGAVTRTVKDRSEPIICLKCHVEVVMTLETAGVYPAWVCPACKTRVPSENWKVRRVS